MLTISPAARAAIEMLSLPDVPQRSGLRIFCAPQHDEQTHVVAVIDRPGPEDEVVMVTGDAGRVAVFIDPEAADLVEDQVLDSIVVDERVTFSLEPQPTETHLRGLSGGARGLGGVLLGVALVVISAKLFMRLGLASERDRSSEQQARRTFEQTGRWPKERAR